MVESVGIFTMMVCDKKSAIISAHQPCLLTSICTTSSTFCIVTMAANGRYL